MKVLIINTYDIQGGAARAAYRLHTALLSNGVNSEMLVQNKTSDDYTVLGPSTKKQKVIVKIRSILDALPLKLYKKRTKTHFSTSWVPSSNIINQINQINPDIVHLHWINDGMIRIEDLVKINAPIVWTLHDNWAFTGGCHIKWGCERFREDCGACPVLGSDKMNDLSAEIFKRKKKTFSKMKNLTIIGLSQWINECSKQSSLLNDKSHFQLPNLINTVKFKPINKEYSRNLWNLELDKKVIIFGAMGATTDINKGFEKLKGALELLKDGNIELLIFGSEESKNIMNFGFPTHYVGRLQDDISLVSLYNAADVIVVPSLQENLSNVILESLSCGTPVVAFDIGGNSDLIEHKKNGYLATPFDVNDLANGLEWVINTVDYDKLSKKSREKILAEFSEKIVVNNYIQLYKNILNID